VHKLFFTVGLFLWVQPAFSQTAKIIANTFECKTPEYTILADINKPKFTMIFKGGAKVEAAYSDGNLVSTTFVGRFIGFLRGSATAGIALLVPEVVLGTHRDEIEISTVVVDSKDGTYLWNGQTTVASSFSVKCTASYR
jgi:hypothetical protein